jgi:hypothetical protein
MNPPFETIVCSVRKAAWLVLAVTTGVMMFFSLVAAELWDALGEMLRGSDVK